MNTPTKSVTQEDRARISECLAHIRSNPSSYMPGYWIKEVFDEARAAGMMPKQEVLGRYCRPGIDNGIVYGGDKIDAF